VKFGHNHLIDRELSWLDFDVRVLELAEDQSLPLLERVKFLSIFHSNMDEFFMVRVASLRRRIERGHHSPLTSGLTPKELLREIHGRAKELSKRVHFLLEKDLIPELSKHGIQRISWDSLSETEKADLRDRFKNEILPILTPLAVDPSHPFPHISGLSLNLGIFVRQPGADPRFVRVKVPSNLPRLIMISENDDSYILQEDLIAENLDLLLPGADIEDFYFFRVTRNQDLDLDEDESEDLLSSMEEELLRRKFGLPVRLEVESGIDQRILDKLVEELEINSSDVIKSDPPLDQTFGFEIYDLDYPELKYKPFKTSLPAGLAEIPTDDFDAFYAKIRENEILLHHPMHSFNGSVVRFIETAAQDPKVVAIKQTLYRTSGDSPIMHALIEAAQSGKQVLAVIEIRARFDEQANVRWARKLEDAGVHVVYGMLNMKTHAKASLVIRKEDSGISLYSHMGTGNYHPKTARFYDDLGIISADKELGQDLISLFNLLSGLGLDANFNRILVAPRDLRNALVSKIRRETANHLDGKPSYIRWKLNSLLDEKMIEELYLAAKAGVKIDIVTRGICAFRLSHVAQHQNVRIRSILGRFLEHSRIYHFHNDGDPEYFIGSADIMDRNLNRRIETLVQIKHKTHTKALNEVLEQSFNNQFTHWQMDENDNWHLHKVKGANSDYQDFFIETITEGATND
jgi:polyphosphate kinase